MAKSTESVSATVRQIRRSIYPSDLGTLKCEFVVKICGRSRLKNPNRPNDTAFLGCFHLGFMKIR